MAQQEDLPTLTFLCGSVLEDKEAETHKKSNFACGRHSGLPHQPRVTGTSVTSELDISF